MKTVLIASGKGGTGKTTTTAMLGRAMADVFGLQVALLDLDVDGPNLAHVAGVEPYGVEFDKDQFFPKKKGNIEVFSPSFLIPADVACAWDGARRMELIHELLLNVTWHDPDIMLCDCPPGTGDEIVAVLNYAREVAGAVIVCTGKMESFVDARRLISLFRSDRFHVPVLGMIESMSCIVEGDRSYPLFKDDINMPEALGVDLIGSVPWRRVQEAGDYTIPAGKILGLIGIKTGEENQE
jgi:ATP-binding protein involved in chromosome partitioning